MGSRTGEPHPQVDKWGSTSNEPLKLEITGMQMQLDVSNARGHCYGLQ